MATEKHLALYEEAKQAAPDQQPALFAEACRVYEASNQRAPQDPEILYLWGSALIWLAGTQDGAEALRNLKFACEKLAAADAGEPGNYKTQYNWGLALYRTARANENGDERRRFLHEACRTFEAALAIKPHDNKTLSTWANALTMIGKMQKELEAQKSFESACEKYQAALAVKPGDPSTLFDWGFALYQLAETQEGRAARASLESACEKLKAILAVEPDNHVALNAWGVTLASIVDTQEGSEARGTFKMACEKYKAALATQPVYHEALYNWANALADIAREQKGAKQRRTFNAACRKYEAALAAKPGDPWTLYNWGMHLYLIGCTPGTKTKQNVESACKKFEAALAGMPERNGTAGAGIPAKADVLNSWGNALFFLTWFQAGEEEKRESLEAACEKYEAALAVKPDGHLSLYDWGDALYRLASTQEGTAAKQNVEAACEKFEATLACMSERNETADAGIPDKVDVLNKWARALRQLFRLTKDAAYLDQARTVSQESEDRSGSPSYELAGVLALQCRVAPAIVKLEACLEATTLPPASDLDANPDLDAIRNDARYLAFRQGLKRRTWVGRALSWFMPT